MSNTAERRQRRRKNAILGGVLVAGAAALITGAGLMLGGNSGTGAIPTARGPVGVAQGQKVADNTDPHVAQCEAIDRRLDGGLATDSELKLCDQFEIFSGINAGVKGVSRTCSELNEQIANGRLHGLLEARGPELVETPFLLRCQKEEVLNDASVGGDSGSSSLCKGAKIVQDGGGQLDPLVTKVCPNVDQKKPSAPPTEFHASADPH